MRVSGVASSVTGRVRAWLNWENAPYIALVFIALIIRLWDLGGRVIHYDEGIHITCARSFFTNPAGWCLLGWTHGPLQFEGTAFFFLFGTNEVTARLLPVIFGTAIVALPYFLRRQLGHWGSLVVAFLLAFSPFLLFYSRYTRNDIYIAFFMLLLVVCLWRYIEDRKARFLYIGAATLSLSFCSKETSFIVVAIVAVFLLILTAKELASAIVKRFDLSQLSAPAEFLIFIISIVLPVFAPFVNLLPGVELGRDLVKVQDGVAVYNNWAIFLLIFLFVVGAVIGLRWNWRRWLTSALVFWGIYVLMYTVFFTRPAYLAGGIWETIAYWITQHEVERGSQPDFYYVMVIPIYEFTPVLFASIATAYYALRDNLYSKFLLAGAVVIFTLYIALGLTNKAQSTILVALASLCMILYLYFGKANIFTKFLIYWAALTLILFSYFGEKMPWLSVTVSTTTIVFAGMFIGRILESFNWRRWAMSKLSIDISRILVMLGLGFVALGITITVKAPDNLQAIIPLFVIGLIVIGIGAGDILKVRSLKPWMVQASMALILLVLLTSTACVALYEGYHTSDEPPKIMIYCGISDDVKQIAYRIYDYAEETGQGNALHIVIDGGNLYDNGFRWYLRDWNPQSIHYSINKEQGPPEGAVLLVNDEKKPVGNESWLGDYREAEQFQTLAWYPEAETYKNGFNQSWYWDYFLKRESFKPYWTSKAWAYFPKTSP